MVFWNLIDEILNALLFLLIGFELLEIRLHLASLLTMLVIIPLSVLVRVFSCPPSLFICNPENGGVRWAFSPGAGCGEVFRSRWRWGFRPGRCARLCSRSAMGSWS